MSKDITSAGNANLSPLELCRKVGHPDSPLEWNKTAVALLCEDIRAQVLETDWQRRQTDKAVMLVALDWAQSMKRLDVILPARTVRAETGVSKNIASKSLRRLAKAGWLISVGRVGGKRNDAYTYLVNPARPLVYKFPKFSRYLWDSTGTYPVPSRPLAYARDRDYVPHWDRKTSESYTQGITKTALEISKTDFGLYLSPGGIRVGLALADNPVRVAELARIAHVSHGNAADILRRKLAPRGLAVNTGGEWFALNEHPGGGWWKGGKWARGTDLLEYARHYESGRMAARGESDNQERSEHDHSVALDGALRAAKDNPDWAREILGSGDESCEQFPLLVELVRDGRL